MSDYLLASVRFVLNNLHTITEEQLEDNKEALVEIWKTNILVGIVAKWVYDSRNDSEVMKHISLFFFASRKFCDNEETLMAVLLSQDGVETQKLIVDMCSSTGKVSTRMVMNALYLNNLTALKYFEGLTVVHQMEEEAVGEIDAYGRKTEDDKDEKYLIARRLILQQ